MSKEKIGMIFKLIFAASFPFLISAIYCLIRGIGVGDLYVPASYNNDCVFYYKMVDAVTAKGGLTGFFGFNESHALYGGFAAWSPLIILPWSLWGFVFGWGYTSALVCNLVLFALAMVVFTALDEPEWKELIAFFALLLLFPSFTIHLLNVLPEIVLVSLALIYMGLAVRACRKEVRASLVVWMLIIAAFLTMIRPYMVLLMILPAFLLGKVKKKWVAALVFIVAGAVSVVANFVIGHFFTSEYFSPLYNTDIIKMLAQGRFSEGFWTAWGVFKNMLAGIGDAGKDAFGYGLTMGTQYVVVLVTTVFAVVYACKKNDKKLRPVYVTFAVTVGCLLAAVIFLLQKVNEGGRHIWIFAILGILLCSLSGWDKVGVALKAALAILLLIFCLRGAMVPTDYDVPVADAETVEKVEYWKTVFDSELASGENSRGYVNTVIWVFVDYCDDKQVVTEYDELYALPAGMGISCCYSDYVINNFDNLKSRYILTDSRGVVSKLCSEAGLKVVGEHENVIMYQRY